MKSVVAKTMQDAVRNGVFPSADLVVARHGDVIHHRHYGDARPGTMFDVSSLTKPICTATLVMKLSKDGLIDPDDTLAKWYAGIEPEKKNLSIIQLMNHVSGLPAWKPYYRELPQALVGTEQGRDYILNACLNEPLVYAPGSLTLYSDIGYILLGDIIEKAANAKLDELFAKLIVRPLGLTHTFFIHNRGNELRTTSRRTDTTASQHVPVRTFAPKSTAVMRRRFAATEDCPWRGHVIHGQVHDQNAFAMGGVAGHAGLFSTAEEIHHFISAFMKGFAGDGIEILKRFFPIENGLITPREPGIHVGGWDTPSAHDSAAGHYSSRNSIGHLGYTGCSIWIDQKQDFWVILLTNRIHPSTTNEKIKAFRPHLHDLIYTSMIADQ